MEHIYNREEVVAGRMALKKKPRFCCPKRVEVIKEDWSQPTNIHELTVE